MSDMLRTPPRSVKPASPFKDDLILPPIAPGSPRTDRLYSPKSARIRADSRGTAIQTELSYVVNTAIVVSETQHTDPVLKLRPRSASKGPDDTLKLLELAEREKQILSERLSKALAGKVHPDARGDEHQIRPESEKAVSEAVWYRENEIVGLLSDAARANNERNHLLAEVTSLRGEVEKLNTYARNSQAERERTLSREMEKLGSENRRLARKADESHRLLETKEVALAQLNSTSAHLEASLFTAQEDVKEAKGALHRTAVHYETKAQRAYEDRNTAFMDTNLATNALRNQSDQLGHKVQRLEEDVRQLEKLLQDRNQDLEFAWKRAGDLLTENAKVLAELAMEKEGKDAAEAGLRDLHASMRSMEDAKDCEIGRLQKALTLLRDEFGKALEGWTNERRDTEERTKVSEERLAAKEKELRDSSTQNARLKHQYEVVDSQLQRVLEDVARLHVKIDELVRARLQLLDDIEALKAAHAEEVRKMIEEFAVERHGLQAEIRKLNGDVEEYMVKVFGLQEEVKAATADIARLTVEKKEMQATLTKTISDLEAASKVRKALEDDQASLRQAKIDTERRAHEEVQALQADLAASVARCEALQLQLDGVEDKTGDANVALEKALAENAKLAKENAVLNRLMKDQRYVHKIKPAGGEKDVIQLEAQALAAPNIPVGMPTITAPTPTLPETSDTEETDLERRVGKVEGQVEAVLGDAEELGKGTLSERVTRLEEAVQGLQRGGAVDQDLENATRAQKQLAAELDEVRAQLEVLLKTNQELLAIKEELTQANQKLTNNVAHATEELEAVKKSLAAGADAAVVAEMERLREVAKEANNQRDLALKAAREAENRVEIVEKNAAQAAEVAAASAELSFSQLIESAVARLLRLLGLPVSNTEGLHGVCERVEREIVGLRQALATANQQARAQPLLQPEETAALKAENASLKAALDAVRSELVLAQKDLAAAGEMWAVAEERKRMMEHLGGVLNQATSEANQARDENEKLMGKVAELEAVMVAYEGTIRALNEFIMSDQSALIISPERLNGLDVSALIKKRFSRVIHTTEEGRLLEELYQQAARRFIEAAKDVHEAALKLVQLEVAQGGDVCRATERLLRSLRVQLLCYQNAGLL